MRIYTVRVRDLTGFSMINPPSTRLHCLHMPIAVQAALQATQLATSEEGTPQRGSSSTRRAGW